MSMMNAPTEVATSAPPAAAPASPGPLGPPPLAQCPNGFCRSFDVDLLPVVSGQPRTTKCRRCGTLFPHPVGTTTAKRLNAKRRKRAAGRPATVRAVTAASATPVGLLANNKPPEQLDPSASETDGLPTETAAHEPILWRWSEVAPEGRPVHREWDEPLDITPERVDQWRQNVEALNAAGHPPYVTTAHVWKDDKTFFREPRADETLAHIARIKREGGRVWALTGYYGQRSLELAARNKFSVAIAANLRDGKGKSYAGETVHHVSSTPDAAYWGTGTIKVAASAVGEPPQRVPVFHIGSDARPPVPVVVSNPYLRSVGPRQTNPYLTALGG